MKNQVLRRRVLLGSIPLLFALAIFALPRIAHLQAVDDVTAKTENKAVKPPTGKHVNFDEPRQLDLGAQVAPSQPIALVTADFDSDGFADIVTADSAGALQLLKGIDPANFAIDPNTGDAARPEPFSASATGASLGISPDFLFAGDFNADGKQDILGAAKGATEVVVVLGDGFGHFSRPVNIGTGGSITLAEAGQIGRPDGQADLAVTFSNKNGNFLAVYEHPESAFKHAPEIIKLPSAPTAIAVGNMDEDFHSDIAVACGADLVVVHERGQAYPWDIVKDSSISRPPAIVETRRLSFTIAAMTVGRFGEKRGTSLAVLANDGNLYHLEAPKNVVSPATRLNPALVSALKAGPFVPAASSGRAMATISQEPVQTGNIDAYGNPVADRSDRKNPAELLAESASKAQPQNIDPDEIVRRNAEDAPRKAMMQAQTRAAFIRGISAKATNLANWEIGQITTDNRFVGIAGNETRLTPAGVSDSPFDDIVVTSPRAGRVAIVSRFQDETGRSKVENTMLDGSGGVLAVMPMGLNIDGLSDLVVLHQGTSAPTVLMSAPSAVFVVNTTADDGDCNFGGSCSLRDAIRRANQIEGSSTIYFNIAPTPSVIAPLTPLPAILRPVTIQGSHMSNGRKLVEINGDNAGTAVDGLKIRTSNAFIFDLAITGFKSQTIGGSEVGGNGIAIESDSAYPNNANNTILECYLGIDPAGTTAKKNFAAGVLIFDSDNNGVSGSTISGNGTGIAVEGGNSNNIANNIIGLNTAGTQKVPNLQGVFLGGANNTVGGDYAGAPNTISGNGGGGTPCFGSGIVVPIFVDITTNELLSHGNSIVGNKIGTDPGGAVGLGNCWQGIDVHPLTGTTIGSIAVSGRNIISDNGLGGIYCEALEAVFGFPVTEGGFCSIMGNNIGTDVSGSYSIYNDKRNTPTISSAHGVVTVGSNYSVSAIGGPGGTSINGACTGFCNLISGNTGGFDLEANVMIAGPGIVGVFNNYIGPNYGGAQSLGNPQIGVFMASTIVNGASPSYFVGGHTVNEGSLGNLIAGSGFSGVCVGCFTISDLPGDYGMSGNLIGTDSTGTTALPNGTGVNVAGSSFIRTVAIGDQDTLGRNVIAGNTGDGIGIYAGFGVRIFQNAIGVNSDLAPLGNGGHGINVGGLYALSTIIGGTDSTTSNIIANNAKTGVKINTNARFNTIRGNTIFNNGNLGIDLSNTNYFDSDGVTLNDDCERDADVGPNELQNYPVLFAPGYNQDGTVHVTGTLISTPFHHFTIDVYADPVADPSGHGEGRSYIGAAAVTVDGNGFGLIDWTSTATVPNGTFISATATDDIGNTSEFSCLAGQSCDGTLGFKNLDDYLANTPQTCPAAIIVNIETDESDGDENDNVCDVDTSNTGLQCSLRAAIQVVTKPGYVGTHTIRFDIPGAGLHTITPSEPLPDITASISIEGSSQPHTGQLPPIEISGISQPAGGALNLVAGSDGSRFEGLVVNRFLGDAITISSNSNSIERCFIGLNATGNGVYPARQSPNGLRVNGSNNTVGGTFANSANFIAGNTQNQVLITGINAKGNNVFGNVIGSDFAGNIYSGLFSGVRIEAGAAGNRIGGPVDSQYNDIKGAKHAGIEIVDGSSGNFVLWNIIRRGYAGVAIIRSMNNTVGIPDVPDGSVHVVQAVDNFVGIHIGDETPAYPTSASNENRREYRVASIVQTRPADAVQTQLNKVFSSGFGSHDLHESHVGVFVGTATKNEIGREGRSGSVIDGNDFGIWLSNGAVKNVVRGNTIGHAGSPNDNGMLIQGRENTVRNNTISENTRSGIVFLHVSETEFPSKNKVFRNFIGVNGGTIAAGNGLHGIELDGQDNDIGLTGQGNMISGNTNGCGIQISANGDANRITDNAIGINRDSIATPNQNGICVFGGLNRIVGNVISGNSRRGVFIGKDPLSGTTPPRRNVLISNRIGTDNFGDSAVPNGWDGVFITDGALQNEIGGMSPGEGNLISGNLHSGILIGLPATTVFPALNEIKGNKIGTNADGTGAIGNEKFGIAIYRSQQNAVGGYGNDIPAARNVISGNGLVGVLISGAESSQNRVSGNYIGVGGDGSQAIGNGHDGVLITVGAHDNTIGGAEPNAGNLIANNGRNGVALAPDAGNGNIIDPNSIYANMMHGITLNETADPEDAAAPPPDPVMNDVGDADTGPNNLQNYPQINLWQVDVNGDLLINYKVDSLAANSSYGSNGIYVEFFESDLSGEGERFIGSNYWTLADLANGGKVVSLGNAAALGIVQGDLITASATDADGNTSEFFPPFAPSAAGVTVGGRIVEPNGNPIGNAMLTLTDTAGHVRRARSNSFGWYRFEDVEVGQTYVLAVSHKRFAFTNQTRLISVVDELTDVDFTSDP